MPVTSALLFRKTAGEPTVDQLKLRQAGLQSQVDNSTALGRLRVGLGNQISQAKDIVGGTVGGLGEAYAAPAKAVGRELAEGADTATQLPGAVMSALDNGPATKSEINEKRLAATNTALDRATKPATATTPAPPAAPKPAPYVAKPSRGTNRTLPATPEQQREMRTATGNDDWHDKGLNAWDAAKDWAGKDSFIPGVSNGLATAGGVGAAALLTYLLSRRRKHEDD